MCDPDARVCHDHLIIIIMEHFLSLLTLLFVLQYMLPLDASSHDIAL